MGKIKDYTDIIVDEYQVIKQAGRIQGHIAWQCKNLINNEYIVMRSDQITRRLKREKHTHNLQPGQEYGELILIAPTAQRDNSGHIIWQCHCKICDQDVFLSSHRLSERLSCGCNLHHSRGEEKIAYLLDQANIIYEREKMFNDLRGPGGGLLRFDFFVDNKYLIEYDGKQHFKSTPYSNWKTAEEQQLYDNLKNQYAEQHNIPLIRIPYTKLESLKIDDLIL